ncbi:MAG: hypothetical protein IPQ07_42140 [Myxococcales bacterium]|nr:hypothetical protein [Myxococcales bacterium]
MTRRIWLAAAFVVACRSPAETPRVPLRPPAQPPALAPAQPPAVAAVDELVELTAKVRAALVAGKVAHAHALIGERAGDCFGEVGVVQRRDGGSIVRGGRITARLAAAGTLEAYVLEPGCVDLADEQVTITHVRTGDDVTYAFHGAALASATFPVGTIRVESSPAWVAVIAPSGAYLAWPRGAATVVRADPPDDSADEGRSIVPQLAGRYLVMPSASGITLQRPDGSQVAVRGCTGPLIAAAPAPRGVALQVGTGPDTSLCVVDDAGATRKVTALGHATCGLGRPQPCAWELAAASPQLLAFSGLRGGTVIVDPSTGARLAYRGAPASVFPPEYATCGDTVCESSVLAADVAARGRLERSGATVTYRPIALAPAPTWCVEGDLLVPCAP